MSSSYDSSDEEFDLQEEGDVAMILAMHVNKKVDARWFGFRLSEIMEGKDRCPQQIDEELFCGEPNIPRFLLSAPF